LARQRLDGADREAVFYSSLPEMVRLGKLDALAIGTRCDTHAPYAVEAPRYDLPLYLEKPVAVSLAQARRLEKAFGKSKCPVVVSFPLRVSPICRRAKQLVNDKKFGEPVHILGFNYVPYGTVYWEHFYRDYSISGGLFLQKATHDFDYLSYLMGSTVVRVAACATFGKVFGGNKAAGLVCSRCREQETCLESPRNRARSGAGPHTKDHPCVFSRDCGSVKTGTNEDCSSALLEFDNGAHGVYTQVFYSRKDAASRGATISGYRGTISFDWYTNALKLVWHHARSGNAVKSGSGASHFGGDIELARDFIGVIRGTVKSRTPIEAGIQSAYACLAARESARTGKFVKVRQVVARRS
ncbi:MAG: Gfo/Idh/MocA family oxidoreductase, partial [Lentisphaerae bacterium]|nr:Gfo/Idh/MocA family oxidoreductase [Lentisphaerota bacterium]